MDLPDMITRLPEADLPFPSAVVKTNVLQSEHGQLVFFQIFKDVEIPAHSHKAQWGAVLEGEVEVTIGGDTRKYGPGSSYYIPAGVVHSARAPAGSKVIDFFEEADRYRAQMKAHLKPNGMPWRAGCAALRAREPAWLCVGQHESCMTPAIPVETGNSTQKRKHMNKPLSLALLTGGILLIIFGVNASNSFGSDVSRFFTGSPTDKAIWMLVGGAVAAVAGLVGLMRGSK